MFFKKKGFTRRVSISRLYMSDEKKILKDIKSCLSLSGGEKTFLKLLLQNKDNVCINVSLKEYMKLEKKEESSKYFRVRLIPSFFYNFSEEEPTTLRNLE